MKILYTSLRSNHPQVSSFTLSCLTSPNHLLGDIPTFDGVHPRVRQEGTLNKESFKTLKGGQTIEYTFDAALLYDLSSGGDFEIIADGFLPYSKPGKKKISGKSQYKSNLLTLNVNGTEATEVRKQLHRRNLMQPDCAQGRFDATRNALAVCSSLAFVAGEMALRGDEGQYVYRDQRP
jgi:deuterolysin